MNEFKSQDVVDFYKCLEDLGIKIWIDGGWAVDSLLSKQTRSHEDLDIVIQEKDLQKVLEFVKKRGYENVPRNDTSAWNFVLGDNQGHNIDFHIIVLDINGNGIYGPIEKGVTFPHESLTGSGFINGYPVRCISAEFMIKFLSPWVH